jgi:hypothetical protein
MGRRAKHADRRDARERKYKPPIAPERFVFAFSYIAAGPPLGGPSNGLATFAFFVVFVSFRQKPVRLRVFVSPYVFPI